MQKTAFDVKLVGRCAGERLGAVTPEGGSEGVTELMTSKPFVFFACIYFVFCHRLFCVVFLYVHRHRVSACVESE